MTICFVTVPDVFVFNDFSAAEDEAVGEISQREENEQEIVSIGFNKVVTRYRQRIDVMFPERTDKVL